MLIINWKGEPYKSAKRLTGCKVTALILINLIGQAKQMGLTEYPDIKIIKKEHEN